MDQDQTRKRFFLRKFSPAAFRVRLSCAAVIFTLLMLSAGFFTAEAAETDKAADTQVTRATLDNGLQVVIVRNTLSPVVATVMNYRVGSNEAPPGFPGMAHAQEHMMFRGSPGLSAGQLAAITAGMGGMFDADTQQMVTQYFFLFPSQDLDVALHIEAIRMRGVLDTEKLWRQERGAIEQEVAQDLSIPEYKFYTQLLAAMFKGTPYAHDPLGTTASFQKTTGAMLKQFYDTWYVPNNAILVIVGDVAPEKALANVKDLFGKIPSKKLPSRPGFNLSPVTPETFHYKTDLPYGLAVISFRMPGYDSPDYAASQILADVLNSQRGDLYALAAEGKSLAAGFNLDVLPEAGLGYAFAAFPKNKDGKALISDMRKVIAQLQQTGVSESMVAAAKLRESASNQLQKNSVLGLAMTWSSALAIQGRKSPDAVIKDLEAVKTADVNRVLKTHLKPDAAIEAILVPETSGQPVKAEKGGVQEHIALKQTANAALPDWAESALKRLSVPPSTVNPTAATLPNGMKLMVQPSSVSDTVCMYGQIQNNPDLQAPAGKEGVDTVLEQLFGYGTEKLDRIAFQKALDQIGADVSAGTDFSLEVLADHVERGVQLLAENQLQPGLPEQAFSIVRQQVAQSVAGELESPDFLANLALQKALYPKGDPAIRHATVQSVSGLTLKDVRDYYQKVFRPDMTTLVVVGNIAPQEARKVVEKYFGKWKATGPRPDTFLPAVPDNPPDTIAVPDKSRVQDQVTLAETIQITRDNPEYYALILGNSVLGGGFYATRLYQDLREKNGLVYYVNSAFDVSRHRSDYNVTYGCAPENVGSARQIVVDNLKRMADSPVGPEELRQARAMLLREIPLAESSFQSIAQGLIHRSEMDLPMDEPILAARHYLTLTAEQVQSAYRKWIRPEGLVQVSKGPSPKR